MLSDLPVIPMTEEVDWYQYDTAALLRLGHPPKPLRPARHIHLPDDEVLLLHLTPK